MKVARLIYLMYKRFRIDFSGMHTATPDYKNNISHLMLCYYKLRLRRFQFRSESSRPRFIDKFYRQFIYLYIYRVDVNNPLKRRKRYKWWFISRRIARLFYLTYKYKQFYRLGQRMVRKEGSWSSHLALSLECRILTFLYRFHISFDVFELRRLVLAGVSSVDDKLPRHCNYLVPMYSMVVITSNWRKKLLVDFKYRILNKRVFFTYPRFWVVSFKFFYAFIKKFPVYPADFAYPFLRKTSGPSGRYKKHILVDLYRGLDISFV